MRTPQIELDQIHPDTELVIIRLDSTHYPSVEQARKAAEQLQQVSKMINRPVLFLDHQWSIEQLTDEQLAQIGLQRIKE